MREIDDIKNMLSPFMRALPLIVPIVIVVGFLANRMRNYSTPMYETEMRMRLDNMTNSFTNNNLYKDFDVLTSSDKVLTEVEVIKSDLIVNKALEAMAIPVSYYRVGKMKTTEIYPDAPFIVLEDSVNMLKRDVKYDLNLVEKNGLYSVQMFFGNNTVVAKLGEKIKIGDAVIQIVINENWKEINGTQEIQGTYQFVFNSLRGLKHSFIGEKLFVKAVDKDIEVVRINFSYSHPQKSADFVNQMGKSYVSDYLKSKSLAATLTSDFIEEKIHKVKKDLVHAESLLEKYRMKTQVLDTKQELDVGLKKVSQLDVQLANLEMKKITMDSLMVYVEKESDQYQKYAPSFEAYGGLLFVELMKKYQSLLSKRVTLGNDYTMESKEMKDVNFNIEQTKSYIHQSIINQKNLVDYQYLLLKERVTDEREKFNDLPVKERNFLVLEREFQHLEKMYNFLTKKKMEADIAKTANLTFHKVIQKAEAPYNDKSVGDRFIVLIVSFATFLILVFFVYVFNYFNSTINSKSKIEKLMKEPFKIVLSQDFSKDKNKNATHLQNQVLNTLKGQKVIAVSSPIGKEGKSFFVNSLILGLDQTNIRVKVFLNQLVTNVDVVRGKEKELISFKNGEVSKSELTKGFDLVIIETESILHSNEVVSLFDLVDHVFMVNRFCETKWKHIIFLKEFFNRYEISNYSMVLNGYSPFSNYMGFISSDNKYKGDRDSIVDKVIFCKEWYKSLWIS